MNGVTFRGVRAGFIHSIPTNNHKLLFTTKQNKRRMWRNPDTAIKSSKNNNSAQRSKNKRYSSKKSAWSRSDTNVERAFTRVKAPIKVSNNTKLFEKFKPNIANIEMDNNATKSDAFIGVMEKLNGTISNIKSEVDQNEKINKVEATPKPVFHFPGSGRSEFEPPDMSATYAASDAPYCTEREYSEFHKVLTIILRKGALKGSKDEKPTAEDIERAAKWLYQSGPLIETKLPYLESTDAYQGLDRKEIGKKFNEHIDKQRTDFLDAFPLNTRELSVITYTVSSQE